MSSPPVNVTSVSSQLPSLAERQRLDKVLAGRAPAAIPVREAIPGPLAPGRDELLAPLQQVNEVLRSYGVEFELAEESSRVVVRIIDKESGELIRQIPSEEALRLAERLDELQGWLVELQA